MITDKNNSSKLIEKITEAIKNNNQKSLFEVNSKQKLLDACSDFLKYEGYVVSKPIQYTHKTNTIDGLIDLFYTYLDAKPKHLRSYRHLGRDRMTANSFVKNRMLATGAKKEIAIRECAEIITTVFKNEDKFNFKYALKFSIFSQNKLGWVTDFAVRLINKKMDRELYDESEKKREEMISLQDFSELDYDLDDILEKINEEAD